MDMSQQQLVSQRCEKLRIFLLFLQLATQHFVAVAGGVTRVIFLATGLAAFFARPVARKIASCNMAFIACSAESSSCFASYPSVSKVTRARNVGKVS